MKIAWKSDNPSGSWRVTGIFFGRYFLGLMASDDRDVYGLIVYPPKK